MIQLRLIDSELESLHPTFAKWWEGHGFPVVPLDALRTMALLAEENGVPVAAAWVYTASTGAFAMLEWLVTDPAFPPMAAARAVRGLIDFAKAECKARGYAVLFTTCRQPALGRLFTRAGFQQMDSNVSHYLATLVP